MIPRNPPSPPTQRKPDGWGWDYRGVAGPGEARAMYTMAADGGVPGYFDGEAWPKSLEQFRGQDQGPLTGG